MSFKGLLKSLLIPTMLFAFFMIASCTTITPISQGVAASDLARLSRQNRVTFSGIGSLKLKGMVSSFSGTMALAMDGGKYRIEIYDGVGQTVFAGGGEPGKMIIIDPKTGKREAFKGKNAEVARFHDFAIPVTSLKSMVYAVTPSFKDIILAGEKNGKRIVTTTGPQMEITYSSQVEKIRLIAGQEDEDGDVVIIIGKLRPGPMAPYAKDAHIDLGGGTVSFDIEWQKVRQGMKFPDHFFTFDELLE